VTVIIWFFGHLETSRLTFCIIEAWLWDV
jgi:hypothetical protein